MSQTRAEVLNLFTFRLAESALGGLSPQSGGLEIAESDGFGSLLLGLAPGEFVLRSGLTSSATHIDGITDAVTGVFTPEAGRIHAVLDLAGTSELTIIRVGVAGAGEVLVVYDANGVPTLTFGDGANTGYQVDKARLPADFVAKMTQASFA